LVRSKFHAGGVDGTEAGTETVLLTDSGVDSLRALAPDRREACPDWEGEPQTLKRPRTMTPPARLKSGPSLRGNGASGAGSGISLNHLLSVLEGTFCHLRAAQHAGDFFGPLGTSDVAN